MLVQLRVTSSIKFAGTLLYTWEGERHFESKVFCPITQRSVGPARARSGDERTSYETTAPPTRFQLNM